MTTFRAIVFALAVIFWVMTFLRIERFGKFCWTVIGLLMTAAAFAATAPA